MSEQNKSPMDLAKENSTQAVDALLVWARLNGIDPCKGAEMKRLLQEAFLRGVAFGDGSQCEIVDARQQYPQFEQFIQNIVQMVVGRIDRETWQVPRDDEHDFKAAAARKQHVCKAVALELQRTFWG